MATTDSVQQDRRFARLELLLDSEEQMLMRIAHLEQENSELRAENEDHKRDKTALSDALHASVTGMHDLVTAREKDREDRQRLVDELRWLREFLMDKDRAA
jgi:hypothetical protein